MHEWALPVVYWLCALLKVLRLRSEVACAPCYTSGGIFSGKIFYSSTFKQDFKLWLRSHLV